MTKRSWTQFPLWALIVVVVLAAIILAGMRDARGNYMTFFAPLLFEINVCAFCVAGFVLLPRLRAAQAFAAGFLILGRSHFLLFALELATMGRGLFLFWQLLTYFAPRWQWLVVTETTAVPGWGFAVVTTALNLWGILGGVLALILNRRKPPHGE